MKHRNTLIHLVELTTGMVTASVGVAYLLEVQPVVIGGAHLALGFILFIEGGCLCYSCLRHGGQGAADDNDTASA